MEKMVVYPFDRFLTAFQYVHFTTSGTQLEIPQKCICSCYNRSKYKQITCLAAHLFCGITISGLLVLDQPVIVASVYRNYTGVDDNEVPFFLKNSYVEAFNVSVVLTREILNYTKHMQKELLKRMKLQKFL